MTFNPVDFAEDTDFERFVLERLGTHRVRPPEPGSVYDVRGGGPGSTIVTVGTAVMGTRLRDELRESLRPVGLGAAYKVLDMLIEHVLRANGATEPHLSFAAKSGALAPRPHSLPVPLDTRVDLWVRLAAIYVSLKDARHAVTHRRAQATAAGDLEVYDDARSLTDTITSAEIESFAAAVHAAAELVIDASEDNRRANIVAWHLNALRARHSLAALPAIDPNAGRRLLVMDLDDLGDGQLRFNIARAREVVDGQAPSLWDLRLHTGGRVFVGRWEEVPDPSGDAFDFHPASPPLWLSEEVPAA